MCFRALTFKRKKDLDLDCGKKCWISGFEFVEVGAVLGIEHGLGAKFGGERLDRVLEDLVLWDRWDRCGGELLENFFASGGRWEVEIG